LTVTFVNEGIQRAIEQAQAAAGDKQVMVVGGANTAQQCLQAGLVDEIHMGIVPVLLGDGLRFFEPLVDEQLELTGQKRGGVGFSYIELPRKNGRDA